MFEEIVKLGEANVRRICGDFSGSRLPGWDAAIQSLAMMQHQQRSNTTGVVATRWGERLAAHRARRLGAGRRKAAPPGCEMPPASGWGVTVGLKLYDGGAASAFHPKEQRMRHVGLGSSGLSDHWRHRNFRPTTRSSTA